MNPIETAKEAIEFFEYKLDEWLWMKNQAPSEAAKIAILALEKQVPEKPSYYVDMYGHNRPGCPECEKNEILYFGQRYCNVCGQAIDWGDGE